MKIFGLKWLITTYLLIVMVGILGVFIPFILIILPILICALYFNSNIINSVLGYIIFIIAAFLLSGIDVTIAYLCITLPVTISVVWLIIQKKRMFHSVIITTGVVFASILAVIGYLTVLTNTNIVALITSEFKAVLELDDLITKSLYLIINDQAAFADFNLTGVLPGKYAGVDLLSMQEYILSTATDMVKQSLPILIVVFSLVSGFVGFYFSHAYLKKHNKPVVQAADFKSLVVPRHSVTAICIMVIACFILAQVGLEIFNEMSSLLMMVFMTVMSFQGYSVIYFFYKEKKFPLAIAILLCILSTVFGIIFWLGFLENIFKIRARYQLSNIKDGDMS